VGFPSGQDSARKALLVGSIPGFDTQEAVELAISELGSDLFSVPDGETGPRNSWVQIIIDRLRRNPALVLKKDGLWSTYDDRPMFKVRRGASFDPESLDLGYLDAFRESRPVVEALSGRYGLANPTHQVGVASGFDLALFTFGALGALRYWKVFNAAAGKDIEAIVDEAGRDAVFQIELVAEMVQVARTPPLLRPAIARWMAGFSVDLPRKAPPGTRFGIHLCYGDLNNRALVTPARDCSAAVTLTNAIVSRWPTATDLDYVHMPLAAGNEPPSLDASYYAPLAQLELPQTTRLVAGFVHEKHSQTELLDVLRLVESAAGRPVDVAAACGLGRREPAVARGVMQASRMLCTVSQP
jgi:hypothetical protein